MKNLLIKKIFWNSELEGYELTLKDDRNVLIQFDVNLDKMDGRYGTHTPVIYQDYDEDFNCDQITAGEYEKITDFIKTNEEIQNKAKELDLIWEKSENMQDYHYKIQEI